MKQLLKDKTVYLIGAIDRAPDEGAGWRQSMQKILRERFYLNVYNPLEKPINTGIEDAISRENRRIWKENGDFDRLTEDMRIIRAVDIQMVNRAHFLICYLDLDVVFCGTMEELTIGKYQKKPVIVFCKQGKKKIPDWLFAMLPHQMFFNNAEEVISYLDGINNGTDTNYYNRWMFFDR